MGMDVNMLACVRALAENRIQDAKKYAFCCCANDNTKKNESQVRRYKNLLLNGPNMIELPANLNGLLRMEDVSGFHAERYYLGKTQWDLFEKIKRGVAVTLKLREYGIPYKKQHPHIRRARHWENGVCQICGVFPGYSLCIH